MLSKVNIKRAVNKRVLVYISVVYVLFLLSKVRAPTLDQMIANLTSTAFIGLVMNTVIVGGVGIGLELFRKRKSYINPLITIVLLLSLLQPISYQYIGGVPLFDPTVLVAVVAGLLLKYYIPLNPVVIGVVVVSIIGGLSILFPRILDFLPLVGWQISYTENRFLYAIAFVSIVGGIHISYKLKALPLAYVALGVRLLWVLINSGTSFGTAMVAGTTNIFYALFMITETKTLARKQLWIYALIAYSLLVVGFLAAKYERKIFVPIDTFMIGLLLANIYKITLYGHKKLVTAGNK